jgi:TRAP-type C4-dicarboxylate transport system permease small subunit
MGLKNAVREARAVSRVFSYLGAVALVIMMLLTTVDVLGRYIFNSPILGTYEMTEFLVLIMIFSFLPFAQSEKTHVSVDLLVALFPKRVQANIELFNHAVCLGVMVLITWMGVEKAFELKLVGEASPNLKVPDYPFVFFLALGCIVMCFEYIRDLIRLVLIKKEDPGA